jgi:DNA-binding GntR family transcriptional regulator
MARTDSANKRLLCDVAFDEIYRRIITLGYDQGQVLHEKQLMAELKIGRTPIREALPRLAACGILDSHPNGAWIVRPITLANIKAVFEALEIMEMGVISLAVRHDPGPLIDEMAATQKQVEAAITAGDILALVESNHRFHMGFYRAARNAYLVHGLDRIRFETKRLAYISYSQNRDTGQVLTRHYDAVRREHGAMMRYLVDRNLEGLRQTCLAHIAAFRDRIIRYLSS